MEAAAEIFADGGYFYLQEVADKVGVHRTTLWRWWQHKEFRQYCERVRRRIVGKCWRQIQKENRAEIRKLQKGMQKYNQEHKEKQERKKRHEYERWIKANVPAEEQKKALEQLKEMKDAT